jgi:hypothetical protein
MTFVVWGVIILVAEIIIFLLGKDDPMLKSVKWIWRIWYIICFLVTFIVMDIIGGKVNE